MRTMTFSNLYLLSQREQRGLQISFGAKPAVVRAGNGFGKSAVVKSLYDAFGASPHKIDQSWQSAQVATVVEFAVDGEPYTVLKAADEYTIFDASTHPLFRTRHVVR